MSVGRRALFLDRDGTIIEDVGYPREPEKVVLLPGAAESLRAARAAGFALVVVSNQSGVARGRITPEEAAAVQARVEELFAAEGVTFDGVYFCFHGPDDGCACRKPAPGMLRTAARELDVDLARSVLVGDKTSDLEAARAASARAVAFGFSSTLADASFSAWPALGAWLLRPA